MAPVLAPAPPATAAPMALAINKRGRPKRKRTLPQTIFTAKKKKMQGNSKPVKHAATKGVRSKEKKSSEYNYLPGDKVIYEKEMRLAINSLHLQNFLS